MLAGGTVEPGSGCAAVLFGRNRAPRLDRSRLAPLALRDVALGDRPVELGDAVELADVELADDVPLWRAVWPKSRR